MPKGRYKHQVKSKGQDLTWLDTMLGDQASSPEYWLCLTWRKAVDVEDLLRRLRLEPARGCLSRGADTLLDEKRLKLVGQVISMVERAIRGKKSDELKRLVKAIESLPILSKQAADPLRTWMLETFSDNYLARPPRLRSVTIGEISAAAQNAGIRIDVAQLRRAFKGLGGVIRKSKPGPRPKKSS